MRIFLILPVVALSLGLVGCSSESEPPTEQIIVREPGQTVATATPDAVDPVSSGKAAFAACAACHDVAAGGPSGVGPHLNGIVGRAAGAIEGFSYSDALGQSGITWTESELDAFIADPTAKVPGTSMAAGAISDAERRAAIVAYLSSLSE